MQWRCGEERAEGLSVLAIARPGLQLEEALVPRVVFHVWLAGIGERLLRASASFSRSRDHEPKLLRQGVAVIGAAAGAARDEEERQVFLSALASLGHLPLVHGDRPELMGRIASWVVDAARWAVKHHSRDRRCPLEPPVLAAAAVDIWGALAERRGEDADLARRREREQQLSGLVELSRRYASEDFRAQL